MKTLHTTDYDKELIKNLKHLANYPELLPFIGKHWSESSKILLIAESHYIATKDLIKEQLDNWYDYSSNDFIKYKTDPFQLHNYINTRYNVDKADNLKMHGYQKPFLHYYNIKNEIKSNIPEFKDMELVFPYFAYYNYFQRPAFVEGESIVNDSKDNEIAYNTLKEVVRLIQPKKIIFISTKAKNSFFNKKSKDDNNSIFKDILITGVPHPASAWWNKKSANYGLKADTQTYRTGREKFIDILKQ